jgi:hypothetical protein
VIGNSYSVTFRRAFDRLVKEDKYAVILTSGYGSAPAPNTKLNNGFDGLSSDYWQRVVPPLLASLKKDDIVLNISELIAFTDPQEPSKSEVRRKSLNVNLGKFAEEVKAKGLNFVILGPLPFARDAQCDPSIATTQWFHSGATSCTFYTKVRTLERMRPVSDLLAGLEASAKLKVLDLNDVFCPSDRCTYNSKNGQILYRDSMSHPSDEAAVLSAQKIRDVLISF